MTVEYDDAWRKDSRGRADKLFPNQGLQPVAELMASAHRYAIDYIEQAPVIVIAATRGHSPRKRNERSYLTGQIAEMCRRGDRLKDVMRAYGVPLPLRAIRGVALTPTKWPIIFRLAKINPSKLAQIIPETSGGQMSWLRTLDDWLDRMSFRSPSDPGLFFEWAASALRDVPYRQQHIGSHLADFAFNNRDSFNELWSRDQAEAAQERWHLTLAKRSDAARLMENAGVAFDTQIDYSPLPAEVQLKGITFTALRSGEELFLEGAAMRHCVASYISAVVTGKSRIYSAREGGKRIATVELKPSGEEKLERNVIDERGYKFVVYETAPSFYALRQLSGPCNTAPAKRIRDAVSAFVSAVNA